MKVSLNSTQANRLRHHICSKRVWFRHHHHHALKWKRKGYFATCRDLYCNMIASSFDLSFSLRILFLIFPLSLILLSIKTVNVITFHTSVVISNEIQGNIIMERLQYTCRPTFYSIWRANLTESYWNLYVNFLTADYDLSQLTLAYFP